MADIFPDRIGLSDKDYQIIQDAYKRAYIRIAKELQDSTDFGYSNRANLLKNIQQIISDYGTDINGFIEKEIPAQYAKGAQLAIDQLNSLGADVDKIKTFSTIDKQAVESLITNTQHSLGAAMAGVTKNMSKLLSSAQKASVKEILIQGNISGEARQTIRDRVISDFQSSGIGSLEDAGGKTWQLDSYSDMLIRTNAAAARNEAITNTLLENDQDFVEVSSHGATDVCADWEGAILSISGDNDQLPDGTPIDGSVEEATDDGLFHPNCEHTLSAFIPDLSQTDNTDTSAADNAE